MYQGCDVTNTTHLNLFKTKIQVYRKDTSKIHTNTFTGFCMYLLKENIKLIMQVCSMLRQEKCKVCDNKVHTGATCGILGRDLSRDMEEKNYGLGIYLKILKRNI